LAKQLAVKTGQSDGERRNICQKYSPRTGFAEGCALESALQNRKLGNKTFVVFGRCCRIFVSAEYLTDTAVVVGSLLLASLKASKKSLPIFSEKNQNNL
jgi:hypothetical protein